MENDIFGGFTAVAQSISDKAGATASASDDEERLPGPEDIQGYSTRGIPKTTSEMGDEEDLDHIPKKGEEVEEEIEEEEIEEEEIEEEDDEPIKKKTEEEDLEDEDLKNKKKEDGKGEEDLDFGEVEPDLAAYLQDELFKQFGFEKGDDVEEFKSIEEVVDFVKKVVEENSKPEYANEEMAALDEYVREGGDLGKYLETTKGGINPESVDIESTTDQKRVIRELFKARGYSDTKIERALERYEDAGVLKEEAEDALELLDEYKEQEAERLLEEQKKQQEYILQEQQKYVESVKEEIEGLQDVRGINITKSEKKQLFDYIFKPTKSGRTQYQEDYIKNKRNMIESAFFTMKGDAFVKKVQNKATSEAASRLRKKLASKGKRGKNQSGQGDGSVSDIWNIASSQLRSPF